MGEHNMSDMVTIDVSTGSLTTRDYTQEEIEYRNYLESQIIIPEPIVDEATELRASALSKLMSLGLTEEEARVIAGV
jgi:hypothetical protein